MRSNSVSSAKCSIIAAVNWGIKVGFLFSAFERGEPVV